MATVTAVITYTPAVEGSGSSTQEAKVTSLTWGGTAFASLSGAQIAQGREILAKAAKVVASGGNAAAREDLRSGKAARQPTS